MRAVSARACAAVSSVDPWTPPDDTNIAESTHSVSSSCITPVVDWARSTIDFTLPASLATVRLWLMPTQASVRARKVAR